MRSILSFILMVSALPAPAAEIGRFVATEQGFAVNSWLVPTRTGVVVIDTQFTVSEASMLVEAVQRTGRPLVAILITHPHPDHYNGTCELLRLAPVPVFATQATIEGIAATAEAKRAQWKPTYGKDYPDATCAPDHVLPHHGSTRIDGVAFQVRDYGPGESLAESVVQVPALHAAFVGDLIYNQVHPWLAEGRSGQWLAQLQRLKQDVPHDWTVYPGHGPAGDVTLISAQQQYIDAFRAQVQAVRGPAELSEDSNKAIVATVRERYPDWQLEMLIPINAQAVAKELREATKQ